MIVEKVTDSLSKKQHLPFVVRTSCPICGTESSVDLTKDYSKDYIRYPSRGEVSIVFAHVTHGEYETAPFHEWEETLILGTKVDFTLTPTGKPPSILFPQ